MKVQHNDKIFTIDPKWAVEFAEIVAKNGKVVCPDGQTTDNLGEYVANVRSYATVREMTTAWIKDVNLATRKPSHELFNKIVTTVNDWHHGAQDGNSTETMIRIADWFEKEGFIKEEFCTPQQED